MGQVYLLTDLKCKICGFESKSANGVSQHISQKHNIKSTEYSKTYLLKTEIPLCKCGCEKEVIISGFNYKEYLYRHAPIVTWQTIYSKDSEEYKAITKKISESVSKYQLENPRIVSEETKKKLSDSTKAIMADPEKKLAYLTKMTETKRRQSESGYLSERHYSNTKTEEEVKEIYGRIGFNASVTKQKLFREGLLTIWNKGLTKETDERVLKYSGENNGGWNPNKLKEYPPIFRNKEFRKYLLERQNGKCIVTEETEDLCLHHIDWNKMNCDEYNLIYVTRATHARIHFNKKYRKLFDSTILNIMDEYKNNLII